MADAHPDYSRLAELAAGVGLHEHLCLIYDTQEEQFAAAVPYLKRGLERGEKCLIFADEKTATSFLDGLHRLGLHADQYLRNGALAITHKRETDLQQGRFDPDWWIGYVNQAVVEAGTAKFSGLRILADMNWALRASNSTYKFNEYESTLNYFVAEHDARIICQYNRNCNSPELILGIIRTHPVVIIGGLVCKNPYYVPPEEFLKPNQAALEVVRLLGNIVTWDRAQDDLRRQKEILQKIFDNVPSMIRFVGPDGKTKLVNRAWERMMGWNLEEILAQDLDMFAELYPDPNYRQEVMKFVFRSSPEFAEFRTRVRDGRVIDTSWGSVRLSDGTSIGIGRDITARKRAEEELQRSRDQLRALAARLQKIREEERTRVAREIHDELGQALTAIKIDMSSLIHGLSPEKAKRAGPILKEVDEAIHSVRRISTELRPAVLDAAGFVAAVEWAAEEFEARTGTKCRLDSPPACIAIDPERATALFRIFQETLTNVARHANATEVRVQLARDDGNLTLEVHDNGRGLGEEELSAGGSLGILGMRERALLLGGEFNITGAPGKGTTVRVRVPVTHSTSPREGH